MIEVEKSRPFLTLLLTSLWKVVTFLDGFLSTLFKERKLKTAIDNRTIFEFQFITLLFVKLDVDQILIFLNVDQQNRAIFQAYRYCRISSRFRDLDSDSFSYRRRSSIINADHRCQICDINSDKILFVNDRCRSADNSDRNRANKNDSSATFSVKRRAQSWLEVANSCRRIHRHRRRRISVDFWHPSLLLILWLQNFIWRNCAFGAYFVVLILVSTCPIVVCEVEA
uniref:Uncharacterized protein n=1 Tax=Romanomermis culicivorax TaxID=13658 RepID=A0A915KXI8_ROMCU